MCVSNDFFRLCVTVLVLPPELYCACAFGLETMGEHHSCEKEIEALTNELTEYTSKANTLKQKYKNSLIVNLQKDVQIRNLEQKIKSKRNLNFVELSDETRNKIKLIGDSAREDSTFVNCVLHHLYNDNIEIIKKKTLSGHPKASASTVCCEISPDKKNTIEKLFNERLSYLPPSQVDEERKKKLNKLIRNAIDNAKKKK